MNKKFSIILAVDDKNGIGKGGDLAWRLSADMKYFKEVTVKTKSDEKVNAVIMGRKTWESIPEKFRPLPERVNYILTRNENFDEDGALPYSSLEACLENIDDNIIENVFIIGGAALYNQALGNSFLDTIYLTKVEGDFDCDVFFNGVPDFFEMESKSEIQEEKGIKFQFQVYKKK